MKIKKGQHFSPKTEIKKGQRLSPKTEIKKGQHLSVKTEFKKGSTHSTSEETRKKISISHMGIGKGRIVSKETREKISKATKGRKMKPKTEEQKRKISLSLTGKKQSAESKRKKSIALKGRKRPPFSKEWRMKIGKGNKGKLAGSKSPNWKGGITSKNELIRKSKVYLLWRKSVFTRDNFICQKTNESGGKLEAHHINNFSEYPELQLAIDNGITLSKKSHREFHKIYGRKNNTKEQIIEFLN